MRNGITGTRRRCTCMMRVLFVVTVVISCGTLLFTVTGAGDSFFGKHGGEVCETGSGNCENEQSAPSDLPEQSSKQTHSSVTDTTPTDIHVIITFTNAATNYKLQTKFTQTVESIFRYASTPIILYIMGDDQSHSIAKDILAEKAGTSKYRLVRLDVDSLAKKMDAIIRPMQHHFSFKPGAYYSHALFFLSIAIHQVMPETMHRVIMLDADLKFRDDITRLYELFGDFSDTNIIGIARENQPVYKHAFWQYRQEHAGSRVGEPPPNGLTGFNSGVLLLDLDKMRQSKLYNSLINADSVGKLTSEFHFKGHLGDQDFFTLLNMKYEELFYVLPCSWNRQLCTWWKDHGYAAIFSKYFDCNEETKIYHGNCDTPIPSD